ncbi:CGGC domain-containing protein [bacterium]|nr:CGGC domain-containing protein [bacterium]PJA73167.1 MAG: CGGC domain-containing protein [bacterium CG_4_9_14_3_um_filter_65_15]
MKKIGIIICDRYSTCAGGKCFRSLAERAGGFARYAGQEVELVGFTTCGGCPGGNVEYAPEEMKANGAEVVHLATGLVVGYPPCPYLDHFREFIPRKFGMEVVVGTHPVPEKYHLVHEDLGTWPTMKAQGDLQVLLADRATRLAYD